MTQEQRIKEACRYINKTIANGGIAVLTYDYHDTAAGGVCAIRTSEGKWVVSVGGNGYDRLGCALGYIVEKLSPVRLAELIDCKQTGLACYFYKGLPKIDGSVGLSEVLGVARALGYMIDVQSKPSRVNKTKGEIRIVARG